MYVCQEFYFYFYLGFEMGNQLYVAIGRITGLINFRNYTAHKSRFQKSSDWITLVYNKKRPFQKHLLVHLDVFAKDLYKATYF